MVLWNGACVVHEIFSLEKILKLKIRHPEAKLIAHPECEEAILNMRNNLNNTNIDLIVLKSARELNLENIRKESSLLIIINVDNTPQGKFIRLLERVSEFNVTIKFIDEKGEFTNSNKNIAEWSRFLEENNIRIEVINE